MCILFCVYLRPSADHLGNDIGLLYDAPERRLQTLQSMLEVATKQDIDSIWIGRDLGHRGGRRTGLALTDDVHIQVRHPSYGGQTQFLAQMCKLYNLQSDLFQTSQHSMQLTIPRILKIGT